MRFKNSHRLGKLILMGISVISLGGIGVFSAHAAPVQNQATGTLNSKPLDLSGATVTLNRILMGNAVSEALAEVSPDSVKASQSANGFILDVLPTINPGDTGLDKLEITLPSGFSNPVVTQLLVNGGGLSFNCSSVASGEYCATISNSVVTILLGAKVTTNLSNIRIYFTADSPPTPGAYDIALKLDDTITPAIAAQAIQPGDADQDPSNTNDLTVVVRSVVDPDNSIVTVDPLIVIADGISSSTITTTLKDVDGNPVSARGVILSSDRNGGAMSSAAKAAVSMAMDQFEQPSDPTDSAGMTTGTVSSTYVGVATVIATEDDDSIVLSMQPEVFFSQGLVLDLIKSANKSEAVVGDVVTYLMELKNTTLNDVVQVRIEDRLPPNFKYLRGSTLLNGAKTVDPSGNRTLAFDVGTIPALGDLNGNGESDSGEAGYFTLSYQLVIGSGATPRDYTNTAVAKDVCDLCSISNQDTARVTVTLDPVFDLGTVIGKVFEDRDEDGWQDRGEKGLAGVMVVLDDGTYVLTDEHGRYHFPVVKPGQRLIKINLASLSGGAKATTEEARIVWVTPGVLAKVNFGVLTQSRLESIGREKTFGAQILGEMISTGVMVVLDDGTYVLTDEHGRYHFPVVKPGQRLIKINLASLSGGAKATTEEARIVWVTPGVLAKVNFGVLTQSRLESIGRDKTFGAQILGEGRQQPVEIMGNTETLTVLINGQKAIFSEGDVEMDLEEIQDFIVIKGNQLERPLDFRLIVQDPERVRSWNLFILENQGELIRTFGGEGKLPDSIQWDGKTEAGQMVKGGQVYQYYLEIEYSDGSLSRTPRRLVGVNRRAAISLNLSGGAFETGSADLSLKAKEILAGTAELLRQYPEEIVLIEGHSDAVGLTELNLELSKMRARAAVDYLIEVENIPADRFIVKWYGESKPIADNGILEGRELNRRVEVKGSFEKIERSQIYDRFRGESIVQINGTKIEIDDFGRFQTEITDQEADRLEIDIANLGGRTHKTTIEIPSLEILSPQGEEIVPFSEDLNAERTQSSESTAQLISDQVVIVYPLIGRTDPNNQVEIDGDLVEVQSDGLFKAMLDLHLGNNAFGLLVRSPLGFTRIANLLIAVRDQDEVGQAIVAIDPIPSLSVILPEKGVKLRNTMLPVSGITDPENQIRVNGEAIAVQSDGSFAKALTLDKGKNQIVVEATDPEGYVGRISREVEVTETQIFFLGFVDGELGQLRGKGFLEGAGMNDSTEYYTQGRMAYYLKGVIAGKYLVTSAFDTGTHEFNRIFKDLDDIEEDRLLTNLDPDKLYPVYGDSSTIVYDTESQGKFYLAITSEELHVSVGNYPLSLTDTELATYQRTLYGGKVVYQSASRSPYGAPDTEIVVFGAEVRQAHVIDELEATGGSLYYLSHREVIEGSEQVTLIVRDKDTGLILSRQPQRQNVDYTIKYTEGRIFFNRPISSVIEDQKLVDQRLLSGNPVMIQVDYETRMDSFEKTAGGGRVRRQIGDHLSIGGTYIKDELGSGRYELKGADTELRLGQNTRFLAEIAESHGTDSAVFKSSDGGLSYRELTPTGIKRGTAWKLAAELDVLEWVDQPGRLQLGGYLKQLDSGFLSNGNLQERGSRKEGLDLALRVTERDWMGIRYDREELLGLSQTPVGTLEKADQSIVQWKHSREWWGVDGEYQSRESLDTTGNVLDRASYGAARLRLDLTKKLTTSLERQETLTGKDNNQTTFRLGYQVFSPLKLSAVGTEGSRGRALKGGAILDLSGGKFYLSRRLADEKAGRTHTTIVGGETPVGTSGKVYSEYQWEQEEEDSQSRSLVGAQRDWNLGGGFNLLVWGEHSRLDKGTDATRRYTVAMGLDYVRVRGLKAGTKAELRRERGGLERVQYLSVNHLELKLSPDFTMMFKYRYSVTRDLDLGSVEAEFEERVIGLAYRPVEFDRLNVLTRYTRLSDQRPLLLGETEAFETLTDVVSIEWSLDLNRSLEWVEKEAAKIKEEKTGGRPSVTTHTYLSIHRLNIRLYKAIDLGLEYRILWQKEASDRREGWLTELSWRFVDNLRFGMGYNFTDFSDNEFSDNDYSVYGWFIRLQAVF